MTTQNRILTGTRYITHIFVNVDDMMTLRNDPALVAAMVAVDALNHLIK